MEKPCGGRLLFTVTQHSAPPEGLGSKSALSWRGRTVWEAVVLLWERGQGERERSRRQHVRAPHFPMGHRSWTETEEVLITQPGLDDIFFFFARNAFLSLIGTSQQIVELLSF